MKELKIILSAALLGVMVLILYGCLEENFIPDPTEKSDQMGGALINNVAWKTSYSYDIDWPTHRVFYFTNYAAGDSVTLTIDGVFAEGVHRESYLGFIVVLKNMSFEKLEDIKSLDGLTVELDGTVNSAVIDDMFGNIQDDVTYHRGGTGRITFKNVKTVKGITYTRVNGEQYHPLIVAGTFEFTFPEISTVVSLGRFDFYLTDSSLDHE